MSAKRAPTERELDIWKLTFRLHRNDKIVFLKLLRDEKLTFQWFVDACMDAYMRADPGIMKVVKDWQELKEVPPEHQGLYTLSHRERKALLDELETTSREQDIPANREEPDGIAEPQAEEGGAQEAVRPPVEAEDGAEVSGRRVWRGQ